MMSDEDCLTLANIVWFEMIFITAACPEYLVVNIESRSPAFKDRW